MSGATMSTAVLLTFAGLLGLAIGSFLNVVIHRVPRGGSVLRPGSACPACGAAIQPWHNIPVVGYVMLRGRCASCGAPIALRYPAVELATAVLFVAVTWRLSELGQALAIPAFLYFAAIGIALSAIDLEHRRLPNAIVVPSYPVLAVLLGFAAIASDGGWPLARAGLGGLALFAFFVAVALAYPAGMGFGDVRLAGLVGGVLAYLGWATLVVGAFLGFLLGALTGVALIITGRGGRRTAIPFGPFMIAGAVLALFAAEPIAGWYLGSLP